MGGNSQDNLLNGDGRIRTRPVGTKRERRRNLIKGRKRGTPKETENSHKEHDRRSSSARRQMQKNIRDKSVRSEAVTLRLLNLELVSGDDSAKEQIYLLNMTEHLQPEAKNSKSRKPLGGLCKTTTTRPLRKEGKIRGSSASSECLLKEGLAKKTVNVQGEGEIIDDGEKSGESERR